MDRKATVAARRFLALIFGIGVFFFGYAYASAASLIIAPSAQSATIGTTFFASVYIQSPDQSVNAISGLLSFPTDQLEVVNFSKADSVVGVWIQEPLYSNQDGTISFEGIILNPGFKGNAGKVLSVRFRVKKVGIAPVAFVSASVLANDGEGTNILTKMQGSRYTLLAPQKVPPAPALPTAPLKSPSLASSTPTSTLKKLPGGTLLVPPRIISVTGKTRSPLRELIIEGLAAPNTKVNLFLQHPGHVISSSTAVNREGYWNISYLGAMQAGVWQVRAQAVDPEGGIVGPESDPVDFTVATWPRYLMRLAQEWGFAALVIVVMLGIIALIVDIVVYQIKMAHMKLRHRLLKEYENEKAEDITP